MRIVVSDVSGHPFQVQLARELARRGHEVLHLSSGSFQTPKGRLAVDDRDPDGFDARVLRNRRPFSKHSYVRRLFQEREMGGLIGREVAAFGPDMVLSSNAAVDVQRRILAATRRAGAGFVFWVQDLYGEAMRGILRRRLGPLGDAVGRYYSGAEAAMLRRSDHVVSITADFVPLIRDAAGVPEDRITAIPNWAPLDEIDQYPRDNPWARANLPDGFRVVYSGTLGFKHDPGLLLELARALRAEGGHVIVFSEGPAADQLRDDAARDGVANLRVSGWLPFDVLPRALAGADALAVVLEPDAGAFSVPSKVLTYLAVGRPILGSIDPANLAARMIAQAGAGLTFPPGDRDGLVAAARQLVLDSARAEAMGRAGRAYAEDAFRIDRIAERFEQVFAAARRQGRGR